MEEKVRIDKFLWCVRLFKKRNEASDACKKGHIKVNGTAVKPSRKIAKGDVVEVKNAVIFRRYRVLDLLEKRVGAKLVENYIEELTSEEDLFKLKMYYEVQKQNKIYTKGGRPTKKDRRDLNKFLGED